jgi:hypothetical protein
MMNRTYPVSLEEAQLVGSQVGCDWTKVSIETFRLGLETELDHCQLTSSIVLPDNVLILMGRFVEARLRVWGHIRDVHAHYQHLDEGSLNAFGD